MVELTLALGFFSIVLLVATSATLELFHIYQSGSGIRSSQQSARFVTDQINRDAHNGSLYEVCHPSTNTDCEAPTVTAAGSRDVLCIYTNRSPSTAPITIGSVTYPAGTVFANGFVYYLENDLLTRGEVRSVPIQPGGLACDRGGAINTQILNAADTAVVRFGVDNRDPHLITYSMDVASRAGLSDLNMSDPLNPECNNRGFNAQFCVLTSIETSVALRSKGGDE